MRLSVVIPTYNKLPLLERTLAALAAQELPANHWETIVVDDGSSDGTADFLAQWSGDPARNLRVVSPGRNVGRASARNLGIRAAAGQWILFLDDDILAPPGLLAAHLEMLQRSPGCGTIGRVRTESALVDGLHFHYLDSRGIAKIRQSNVPARYFVTQNAAVPRRALLNINGFDEEFAAYGLEDMEVAFRLEEQQRIAFLPTPSHLVGGFRSPHRGQRPATNGSPSNRPSTAALVPDAVASDVTVMSLIRIAMASPTSAPSTATGIVTSCPPRRHGVSIGPQQPGAVFATILPPSRTGPSIGRVGSSTPSVNRSTSTVSDATVASFSARFTGQAPVTKTVVIS